MPPPEIWAKILEYLPKRSLMVVRTLSSSFYALSSPLLYSRFEYHPQTNTYSPKTNTFGSVDNLVNRELARLAFWSSDEVSSHVRTCNISHAGYVLIPVAPRLYLEEAPTPLADALFSTISRFYNLRSLPLISHIIRCACRRVGSQPCRIYRNSRFPVHSSMHASRHLPRSMCSTLAISKYLAGSETCVSTLVVSVSAKSSNIVLPGSRRQRRGRFPTTLYPGHRDPGFLPQPKIHLLNPHAA
ncbi:hypothetical protein B0H12DRAFT_106937 [Mycena haematopus]|nr:hypothetical protein B0H12DRAFT_106937 [Mycena haematopus]